MLQGLSLGMPRTQQYKIKDLQLLRGKHFDAIDACFADDISLKVR